MDKLVATIWTEKYRSPTVKGLILPLSMKRSFNKFVEDKEIPNMLLCSSSPGTGKTTIAKALANDIGCDSLYINTSSETGIDTLRSIISKFATSLSMFSENDNTKKICILDEFDYATVNLQAGLRAAMEEYHNTCRFILTCNYATKIIEPLKSRCQIFDFNMTEAKVQEQMKPLIVKRLITILTKEKIVYTDGIIEKIVETFYPDMRRMINLLQQYSKQAGCINDEIFSFSSIDSQLYELIISKKLSSTRKFLMEKNYDYTELYSDLFQNFIPKLSKEILPRAIIILGEYAYRDAFVKDKELNFVAGLVELMAIL